MNDQQFWSLIDSSRESAKGDPYAHIEALTSALAQLQEAEIIDFDRHFTERYHNAYSWDLWAGAYIIGGGCSDDGFMDFRSWLISKGQKAYDKALADAQSLVQVIKDVDDECQIEGFQYAAPQAWAQVTGKDDADFPHSTAANHPNDPTGNRWQEDDLPALFPKLWRKFGE